MRVALDAMGGDNAPQDVVSGAISAVRSWPQVQVVLVGRRDDIETHLKSHDYKGKGIEIVHAPEVVRMEDSPTEALRRKKHSSMKYAVDMVKDGSAQAFVTAGNTGAMVGFSTLNMGRMEGISRPAIVTPIPSGKGIFALIDAGANVSCTPQQMNQFAIMGSIYMQQVAAVRFPRVALLNIGTEETKGTPFIKDTHRLLRENKLVNYVGYVEGHTIFEGDVDVVLTDGFLGNMVLKISEGVAQSLMGLIRKAMRSSIQAFIGAALARKAFIALKKSVDVSEFGGAMLLGLNGVAIKCHGRADSRTIYNGIKVATEAVSGRLNEQIRDRLKELNVEAGAAER